MEHVRVQPAGPAWEAPAAAGPVRARLTIPGSKSETNRALVLAALADGPGTIRHPLRARDTLLMRQALTALGATITDATVPDKVLYGPGGEPESPGWQVTPGQPTADTSVHVGNAGTVMRFAPPVAAGRRRHARRVGLVAVRLRAAARRAPLRQGPGDPASRRPGAFCPAHRHDGPDAPKRRRRGGGVDGGRASRSAQHLARPPWGARVPRRHRSA